MNKQNLWFITLFSIILILSIYYISIPNNILEEFTSNDALVSKETNIEAEESSILVALRVENDEEVLKEISELQNTLLDTSKTIDEKNIAYENLKNINANQGKEEEIEKLLKDEFNYDSFVKINKDQVSIIISNEEHSKEIANKIILKVQEKFDAKKYITIKFQ